MKDAPRILPHVLVRVLPVTMAVLLAVWFAMRLVAADTLERDVRRHIDVEANHGARQLGDRLWSIMTSITNLAANDLLINSLIDTTARENYLPLFFQSLRIPGPENARITLTDYRGRRLAANGRDTPGYENAPWLEGVMKGKPFFHISPEGLEAAAPVLYEGSPEGLVALFYGPDRVPEILSLSAQQMAFAVFNKRGECLFSSADAPWKTAMSDSGAHAKNWIETRRKIPGFSQLTLVCGQSTASAFAPLRRLDRFFLVGMCLNILALAGAVFLAVRMVARPLWKFAADMDRRRELSGQQDPVSESGPEEFRELARSFNRLMGDLALSDQRVRESEATARAILNASPAAIVLLDREGIVLDCNDTYPARFGISRQSLVGSWIWDLFPGETSRHRKEEVKGVFHTGERFHGEDERDGIWKEYHIEPAVRGPDGQVQSVVVEALDITIRKRFQEEARIAHERRAAAAGCAEMSAMVLHHIGNAITPVKVYMEKMADETRDASLDYLEKAYLDLLEHRDALQVYLNENGRGRRVFEYMKALIASLKQQRDGRRNAVEQIELAVVRITEMLDHQQRYMENGAGMEAFTVEHPTPNEEYRHGP